jgi:hypothetical protein
MSNSFNHNSTTSSISKVATVVAVRALGATFPNAASPYIDNLDAAGGLSANWSQVILEVIPALQLDPTAFDGLYVLARAPAACRCRL